MLPGQRTSRRLQALESQALNPGGLDDGYDDFGIPTASSDKKGRASTGSAKRGGLFGRMKRGSNNNPSAALDDNDSDDEGGSFSVVPGVGPASNRGEFVVNNNVPPMQGYDGMPGMPSMPGTPGNQLPLPPGSPGNLNHGDISMDQLTAIKDRHRYPTMEGDVNGNRAMSLTSMSNYDTTPIIPMLGPLNNFQSGSSHNKSSQQDKYRQRMIDSRRALMSSETGIPLSGNPTGTPQNGADPMHNTPRTMSLASMNSQMSGQGRMGPAPGRRSNTMSSNMGMQMQGQPMGPQNPQGFYGGPHMQGNNGQWMRPGMANPPPPGGYQGPVPPNGAPYLMQPPGSPMGPRGGRNMGPLQPHMQPQMPYQAHTNQQLHPNQLHPNQAYPNQAYPNQHIQHNMGQGPQEPSMGPPMATPHMGATSPADPGFSPADQPDFPSSQFHRGVHPPQVGLQRHTTDPNDDELDFGPLPPSPPASAQKPLPPSDVHGGGAKPTAQSELQTDRAPVEKLATAGTLEDADLSSELSTLKDDVRVLSIVLAESTRRELDLVRSKDEKAGHPDTKSAEALAKVYSQLALERSKREAAEVAAKSNNNDSAEVYEKLAEADYRHSEATHLLSMRTEQYNALNTSHAHLKEDFAKQQDEITDLLAKTRKMEVSQRLYEQDKHLKSQVETLEQENAKLRDKLDQFTSRGPLGSRISALEDQRSALQEALRAMRERKDTEIRSLNNRIEMLTLNQQRRNTSSGPTTPTGTTPGPSLFAHGEGLSSSSLLRPNLHLAASGPREEGQLALPRIRNTASRPASPLHLGLDYNR